jgi:hypothetical protein
MAQTISQRPKNTHFRQRLALYAKEEDKEGRYERKIMQRWMDRSQY